MSLDAVLSNSMSWHVETCDVLDGLRRLPKNCVHSAVTSPPYFGLRDYGVDGQIGLEPTPAEYVANLVAVFHEVRRVLRPDGTLWLNIGDSYANDGKWGGHTGGKHAKALHCSPIGRNKRYTGLMPKELIGIPWMLAFALRADGWRVRSEIIWSKPNGMTESVNDRPTKAHEQIFLLTKSHRYFYDKVAGSEPVAQSTKDRLRQNVAKQAGSYRAHGNGSGMKAVGAVDRRNLRSVWTIPVGRFSGAHFATMPAELARKCLVAGTSERGCCEACGNPWKRITVKERVATRPGTNSKVGKRDLAMSAASDAQKPSNPNIVGNRDPQRHVTKVRTIGWEPGCSCQAPVVPCLVLDNFSGAGTTGLVARRLGLRYIGLELNSEYADLSRERIRGDSPLFNQEASA